LPVLTGAQESIMLFRRLFLCALLVGVCAGLAYSAVQRLQVIPIIAAAEVFESALPPEPAPAAHAHAPGAHVHEHGAWEPQDGFERIFWTVVSNLLGASGFALLLIPAFAWWDRQRGGNAASWRSGLLWGVAGWLCFYVWPSLGMRAELPGEAAADTQLRQAWWLLAAACAIGGLALLAFVANQWRWLGLALLVLPFVVGAPHADGPPFAQFSAEAAVQMAQLKSQFVVATAIASAVQWLVIGALAGLLIPRWLRPLLLDSGNRGALQPTLRRTA
jgi:cobalt transporter subunit CbtA